MITENNLISRLGFGLYNGVESDEFDMKLLDVMRLAVKYGITLFDCAPCYRNLRSEIVLGKLLNENLDKDLHVSTKGGFIPFDFSKSIEAENEFINSISDDGLLNPELFDQEYFQTFDTNYLNHQLDITLANLNRRHIDVYYIHNPEYLLYRVGYEKYLSTMKNVIQWLKKMITIGKISSIGIASWEGFFKSRSGLILQLEDFVSLTNSEGIRSYLQYVQVPYNLSQTSGVFSKSQVLFGEKMSLFRAAELSNIALISTAPLNQGKLINYTFPEEIKSYFNNLSSASLSLNFVLSTPGISSTLISTTSIDHMNELISLYNSHNQCDNLFFKILSIK
jgi:aryl-alcohol dehydrogenase-like predicted oxidoreductase